MFVEDKVIRTRPFDFGTDAIERMRVASQSMLDADFEYGLQSYEVASDWNTKRLSQFMNSELI